MGTVTIGGNAKGRQINPVLYRIITAAAARSPYDVQIFSGDRAGSAGGSRHNSNNALDIALIEPGTKTVIPNYKSSTGFPIYEQFAKIAREEQMTIVPEMADQFRWGGGFSDQDLDLMHFDFKPGGAMANYTWEGGGKLTPEGEKTVAKLGPGKIYYDGKRYDAPNTTYTSLWGREPIPASMAAAPPGGVNPGAVSPTTAKLAGVILAEARGEGRDGMIGVGNVVMNRANAPGNRFPKSIDEVINDEFAAPMGPDDVTPEQWQEATEIAMGLQGGVIPDNTEGAVYFANVEKSDPNAYGLIKASGPATVTIGNHTYHRSVDGPVQRASPVANIVQARDTTDVSPSMATRGPVADPPVMPATPPPFSLSSGTASTGAGMGATAEGGALTIAPTPRLRPANAGMAVAPPPVMTETPPPFALNATGTAGGGAAGTVTGKGSMATRPPPGEASYTPMTPNVPPTPLTRPVSIADASGNDFSGTTDRIVADVPTPPGRPNFSTGTRYLPGPKRMDAPYPVGTAPGFEHLGGPRVGPTIASSAPIMADTEPEPIVQPPTPKPLNPAPAQAPVPEPEPAIAGTLFADPGDTMASALPPDLDPASMGQMGAVSAALPTGAGGSMATSPPPISAPEIAPAPTMVSAPPPVQTHRPVTPPPAAPATSMASAPPPAQNWLDKAVARLIAPNTGGSKGFVPNGKGGVSPGGYTYATGDHRIGAGGQYTTAGGRTITYVQDDSFGQPGYFTGYG